VTLVTELALPHRRHVPGVANLDRRDVLHHGALDLTRRFDCPATVANYRERVLHRFVDLLGNGLISDNYFCRLATTTSAGGSAVRTACATVRS
jgi:hypothetical protein